MKILRQYISFLTMLLVLLAATGCTKEEIYTVPTYAGRTFDLELGLSRSAYGNEIGTYRILVFSGGEKVSDTRFTNSNDDTPSARVKVARGNNNFYVFCNETPDIKTAVDNITSEGDIEKISYLSTLGVGVNIPMYGKVIGAAIEVYTSGVIVTVDGVTKTMLVVNVKRLAAKLSLTFIKNIENEDEDFVVEELSISIHKLPKYSLLKESVAYTSKEWAANLLYASTNPLSNNGSYIIKNGQYSLPNGIDHVKFDDIYLPEHILEEAANGGEASHLLINAKCRLKKGSTQAINSVYIVNIGQKPPGNHHIPRNNHFDIYLTIKGIGAIGIYAEIVVMDMYDIPINWKPIEGLVVVSDKESDFDPTTGTSKNINVWNDYSVYSGILKVYHSETGFRDVLFKYGSLIAVENKIAETTEKEFVPPTALDELKDILWYPSSFGNPYQKITSWNDIPYNTAGNIQLDNSQSHLALGDPCKLAGLTVEQIGVEKITDNGQWRMATPSDFDILHRASDNDASNFGYKAFHRHLLPNVKERTATGVLTAAAGTKGNYWTTEGMQTFSFTSTNPAAAGLATQDPSQAFTVRCVRTSIPKSEITVEKMPTISYQGNVTTGVPFSILSNVPYWTATLIDDPNDPDYGNTSELDDFSFAPGATNVRFTEGKFKQSIPVFIKRKEIDITRKYNIRITGMGYNGVTETAIVTASQSGYTLYGELTFTPTLSKDDKIPVEGGSYEVSVSLKPNDVAIPIGELRIDIFYNNEKIGESTIAQTESYKYVYEGLKLTVPKNETPDEIGINFRIFLNNRKISDVTYPQKKR